MKIISFECTKEETALICKIVDRAVAMNPEYDRMTAHMDLSACHANGCPLDFEMLLAFPDFDFSHDVFGIARHIDRDTGELTRCFLPRCAK